MFEGRLLTRQAISNVALTLSLILGAVLCYLLAAPFLAAVVWSVTLAVLFSPLDAIIQKKIRSPVLSAAATVAIMTVIVVVPAIVVAGNLLNEAVRSTTVINAVWGTIVVGLVDNVVYPMLVGNKLRMHPVPSFIAVVGGLMLLGAPGVVLGPLIVAVYLTLIEIWRQRTANRVEIG